MKWINSIHLALYLTNPIYADVFDKLDKKYHLSIRYENSKLKGLRK